MSAGGENAQLAAGRLASERRTMVRKPIPKKQSGWTKEMIYCAVGGGAAVGLVIIVLATIFSVPSRAVVTGKVDLSRQAARLGPSDSRRDRWQVGVGAN